MLRRLPEFAYQLTALFEVHRALESDQLLGVVAGQLSPTGKFPEKPAAQINAAAGEPATERPGTVIGPYKLLQQIGEGGMGTVYMAEQSHPVQRKVALKIIKPGMDSRQVIARFEAERQALALMDHPNIAKVLDAGTIPFQISDFRSRIEPTAANLKSEISHLKSEIPPGRPYFVMELVKGLPITRYCDEHRLTPKERLELFVPVCQAIQHAHQKGIIHRDIKPSNVMVCIYDGKPVPKVIDFGVAKATGPKLTERTLYTEFGAIVGTFEYMSPEQAVLDQLDVDTRSDIYSLGVLLYELLTGTTPLERKRLKEVTLLELLRLVREEEAPRPSTRLSTAEAPASIAANRGTEPKKLSALIRGELDWIVLKALEKDRNRRYETAGAFAADVQRFLHDHPVEACPPSVMYRFRKLARRNKRLLLATGLLLLTLVAGIIGTSVALVQARFERRQAESHFHKARQAVDEYFTLVSEGALLEDPAQEPLRKQLLQAALRYYESFVHERSDDPELRAELAAAYIRIANITYALSPDEDWLPPFLKSLDILQNLLRQKPNIAALESLQAGVYRPLGAFVSFRKTAESIRALEKACTLWEGLVAEHPTVAGFRSDLAAWQSRRGLMHSLEEQREEAARCYQKACDLREELLAANPDSPHSKAALVISLNELAMQLTILGQLSQAKAASRRAMELAKKLAQDFPEAPAYPELLAQVYAKVGQGYGQTDRLEEVEDARRQALGIYERLARAFPMVARYRRERCRAQWAVGNLLWSTGRRVEATDAYRSVAALAMNLDSDGALEEELVGRFLATCMDARFRDGHRAIDLAQKVVEHNPRRGVSWRTLGIAHCRAGNWKAAIAALEKSMELRKGGDSFDWFFVAMARWQLGDKKDARKWYDQAVQWMQKHKPKDEELGCFRAEAEKLLEVNK
jgi:serine/threonine protein kinase/tetratricopeptide (TPR) repeat protein